MVMGFSTVLSIKVRTPVFFLLHLENPVAPGCEAQDLEYLGESPQVFGIIRASRYPAFYRLDYAVQLVCYRYKTIYLSTLAVHVTFEPLCSIQYMCEGETLRIFTPFEIREGSKGPR